MRSPSRSLSRTTSEGELERARGLRAILEGATTPWLHGPVKMTIDRDKVDEFRDAVGPTGSCHIRISFSELPVDLCDQTVVVGPMTLFGEVQVDVSALDGQTDGDPEVQLEALGDGHFHAMFGALAGTEKLPPGRGWISYKPLEVQANALEPTVIARPISRDL